jgi:hypothetical protein
MSLERKDLRLKLDADDHAGLQLLAEADDVELAHFAERVLVREIRRRVHAAIVVADEAKRLGISGKAIPASD